MEDPGAGAGAGVVVEDPGAGAGAGADIVNGLVIYVVEISEEYTIGDVVVDGDVDESEGDWMDDELIAL